MANEQRLIDANALLEKFQFRLSAESMATHSVYLRTISDCVQIARKLISEAPTVDAVEVVRCKACIYWQDNNGGYPHEECRWGKCETPDPDDFCSYGERRTDG